MSFFNHLRERMRDVFVESFDFVKKRVEDLCVKMLTEPLDIDALRMFIERDWHLTIALEIALNLDKEEVYSIVRSTSGLSDEEIYQLYLTYQGIVDVVKFVKNIVKSYRDRLEWLNYMNVLMWLVQREKFTYVDLMLNYPKWFAEEIYLLKTWLQDVWDWRTYVEYMREWKGKPCFFHYVRKIVEKYEQIRLLISRFGLGYFNI